MDFAVETAHPFAFHARAAAWYEERLLLARILKKSLARLDKMLNGPAFNYYLHIQPKGKDFHFHMELLPRLAIWAGFELGSGMYINPVAPEAAAKAYRGD